MNPQPRQQPEASDVPETQFWIENGGVQSYQESRVQFAAGDVVALEDLRSEFSG